MCGLCFLICLGVFYTQSEAYLGECPCELEKNVCSTLGNVFLLTRSHLSLSSGGGKRSSRLCSSVCGTALRAGAARLCGGALPARAPATLTAAVLRAGGLGATWGAQLPQGRVSVLDAGAHPLGVQLTWGTSRSSEKVLCFCAPQKNMLSEKKVQNIVYLCHHSE